MRGVKVENERITDSRVLKEFYINEAEEKNLR